MMMTAFGKLLGRKAPQQSGRIPDVIALPDANKANPRTKSHQTKTQSSTYYATGIPNRTLRKRLSVLLVVVGVPAMAAPGDFGALPGAAPSEAEQISAQLAQQMEDNPPMSFERPGMSFPGSAFYFLADPVETESLIALPTTDATDIGAAEADHQLGAVIDSGPAASPFFAAGGLSHERAQQCLAQAVWYEAASESEAGQRAVAQVVLNRVAHPDWPASVCGVVYQGSHRNTGCQFTFTCDGSLARRAGGASWLRAQRVAREALSGSVYRPVGHATHYHTLWVNPYWASSLDHIGTIGAHRFYRNRGAGGRKEAFTERYAGFEPSVSGRMTPRSADLPDLPDLSRTGGAQFDFDPARDNRSALNVAGGSAQNEGSSSDYLIEPVLADPALSNAGQAKEEYARAGQWKSDAARQAAQDQRTAAQDRPPPR